MISERLITLFLDALHGLTMANVADFCRSMPLVRSYERTLSEGRFEYRDDILTCGERDCWSTFRDLHVRYPAPAKVPLDCEDAACAHAAYLAIGCVRGVAIGLVPGAKVSHAVVGVDDGGSMKILDPSRWYGMRPTTYQGVRWKKVS